MKIIWLWLANINMQFKHKPIAGTRFVRKAAVLAENSITAHWSSERQNPNLSKLSKKFLEELFLNFFYARPRSFSGTRRAAKLNENQTTLQTKLSSDIFCRWGGVGGWGNKRYLRFNEKDSKEQFILIVMK